MSQIQAKKKIDFYYRMPKTSYEQFINKKWVERKDIFETKKSFIKKEDANWKSMNKLEKEMFMKALPPSPGKSRIGHFFKPKTSLKTNSLSKNQTEKDDLVIIEPSDIPSSSTPRLSQTSNANEAIYDRETFLNEKEMEQLKTFFTQMEIPFTNFFTEDVKNDQKLLDCFKTFAYEWDKFSELKTQYEGGKARDRETQLSSKLVEIDASIEQIKLLLEEICSMSSKKTLNTYEMSQSYLKKANLITETIVALGALKKMIINHDFLTSLRRRLKQQNDVTNKSFARSENELLNFFCENDTKLKWGVV